MNRGYRGYNTTKALMILPYIIPPPSQGRIRLFSIFLGANDARLPNTADQHASPDQHVSKEQYKANLTRILEDEKLKAHAPKFVLITPSPIDERFCTKTDTEKGFDIKRRTAETTAAYAQVVRDLGREKGIPVVDVWTAMMKHVGWDGDTSKPLPGSDSVPVNQKLQHLLPDGLHYGGEAYRILYKEWTKTVREAHPDLVPDAVPEMFPAWNDEEAWAKFNGDDWVKR